MLHTPLPGAGFSPADASAPHVDSIAAINIVKEFHTEHGTRRVLDGISFEVRPGERMAVLGRNGAGKSTLIKVLSGLELPSSGSVYRGLKMSWPIALGGGFEGGMTGYDNVRFLCEIYGAPLRKTLAFVDDFTELSEQLYTAVRFYSDGMRARLAFALSLAIDFDCYLIDEVILVGDQRFQEKCRYELFQRRKDRALIVAIHDTNFVREHCNSALILKAGRARVFHDVELAANIYSTL